ncbi:hypothetical protein WBQ88_17120 [Sphingopyxis sp. CCNWLW253]
MTLSERIDAKLGGVVRSAMGGIFAKTPADSTMAFALSSRRRSMTGVSAE